MKEVNEVIQKVSGNMLARAGHHVKYYYICRLLPLYP